MKDETYLFDDGTEPTVRRLPKGCDQPGRYPEAAHSATEVGADDAPESLGNWWCSGSVSFVSLVRLLFLWGCWYD